MSGGHRRNIGRPTKGFQPFEIASDFVFTIEIPAIICAQLSKSYAKLQHMANRDEHGMSNGIRGAVP